MFNRFKILDFLAGETHFYQCSLNLYDPAGKAKKMVIKWFESE